MTETNAAAAAWGNAWLDAQRNYFDTMMDMTRRNAEVMTKSVTRDEPPANPFATGLDQWWKMMAPSMPEESRKVTERLMDMNKGYLQMGEQLWSLAQGMQSAMKAGQSWQQSFQDQVKTWQDQFGGQKATAGWNTLWGLPMQHWRQIASSYSMMPGDVEKAMRGGGPLGAETLQHALKGMLSTPAVGYTREMQEDWQEWMRLWLEHAQVVQKYEQLLTGVGTRTLELMGTRMMNMLKDNTSVENLRQAYDLWVDCAEEAYGELARSSEFTNIQAQLTNTLMAVKRREQLMVEEFLSAFNLPTRTELDTAHQRIHGLRRELNRLRHRLEDSGVEDLHEKIDQLRAEVRALAANSPAGSSAAATADASSAARKPERSGKSSRDTKTQEG